MEKKALGKGLEALLPTSESRNGVPESDIRELPIDQILPSRYQPRKEFAEAELAQLAESVKLNGLLQPVLVRRKGDGYYELIAGERRLRAAKLAGFNKIPAIVRNSSDEQAMELALVENLQRKDLNPMEAAHAYHRLVSEFGFTQDRIAQRVGKDRSSIANIVRLINLPNEIQTLVESGQISTGHAKVLLGVVTRPELQIKLARQIAERQLSVRQAETLAASYNREFAKSRRPAKSLTSYGDLESRLQKRLGTRVRITSNRRGGKIVIEYFTQDELDRLVELLLG